MKKFAILGAALLAATSGAAFGQTWAEQHTGGLGGGAIDAGDLVANANITSTPGPNIALQTITGSLVAKIGVSVTDNDGRTLTGTFFDADVYCITVTNPALFSAIATGGDTTLSIFRPNGTPVAYNDNRTDSATLATARIAPGALAAEQPGAFFIAVSRTTGNSTLRGFTRPLDGWGGSMLFPGQPNETGDADPLAPLRRADLAPSNNAPLGGWELRQTTLLGFNLNYTISLNWALYHVPAPGSLALLGLGMLGVARRRR